MVLPRLIDLLPDLHCCRAQLGQIVASRPVLLPPQLLFCVDAGLYWQLAQRTVTDKLRLSFQRWPFSK